MVLACPVFSASPFLFLGERTPLPVSGGLSASSWNGTCVTGAVSEVPASWRLE